GSVAVRQGALGLRGVGPGFLTTGTFAGAAGTTMSLGYQDMAATASITGDAVGISGIVACPIHVAGTASVSASFTNPATSLANIYIGYGGTADFRTGRTITTGDLTLDSGEVTGTDSLAVHGALTVSAFSWATGFVNAGSGAMTVDAYGPATFATYYPALLDGVTFNNHASATLAGSDAYHRGSMMFLDGAVFNNLAGASVVDSGGDYGTVAGIGTVPASGHSNNPP